MKILERKKAAVAAAVAVYAASKKSVQAAVALKALQTEKVAANV